MSLSHPWFIASQDVEQAVGALEQARTAAPSLDRNRYKANTINLQDASSASLLESDRSEVDLHELISAHLPSTYNLPKAPSSDASPPTPQQAIQEAEALLERLQNAIRATKVDLSSLQSTQERTESEDEDLEQSLSHVNNNLQRYKRWKQQLEQALEETKSALDSAGDPAPYIQSFRPDVESPYSAPQRVLSEQEEHSPNLATEALNVTGSQEEHAAQTDRSYDPDPAYASGDIEDLGDVLGIGPSAAPEPSVESAHMNELNVGPTALDANDLEWSARLVNASLSAYEPLAHEPVLGEPNQTLDHSVEMEAQIQYEDNG